MVAVEVVAAVEVVVVEVVDVVAAVVVVDVMLPGSLGDPQATVTKIDNSRLALRTDITMCTLLLA